MGGREKEIIHMQVLYCFPDSAGQPFRPANGTEGEIFEEAFCMRCQKDAEWYEEERNPCGIHSDALIFGVGATEFPKEWIFDQDGWPTCTAFQEKNNPDLQALFPGPFPTRCLLCEDYLFLNSEYYGDCPACDMKAELDLEDCSYLFLIDRC